MTPRGYLFGLLLTATPGASLVAQGEPGIRTGASAAVTFSRFAGTATEDPRVQYGFGVGGFLTFGLTRNIALQPELQYVQKGARFRTETSRSSLLLGYLQVPLLLKLRVPAGSGITPHLYGGAAAAYRLDCRLNVNSGNSSVSQPCSNLDEPPPRRWDTSVIGGVGVDFGLLFVDLRFDLGLSRIGATPGQEDIKNRALYLMVGTAFGGVR